ncbi:MAG TPA: hypothetical protein VK152_04875 [Paludibacter sp.]|nr:hypothetical protein [Paludibacter sp.]
MSRRINTILTCTLSISGMLILLLYSPWGSPGLYSDTIYFTERQEGDFSKPEEIKNAPTRNFPEYNGTGPEANGIETQSPTTRSVFASFSGENQPQPTDNYPEASSTSPTEPEIFPDLPHISIGEASDPDLSLFSNSTTVETGQDIPEIQTAGSSGTRLNGPLDEPVPIPNGWSFVLLLAVVHIILKHKQIFVHLLNKGWHAAEKHMTVKQVHPKHFQTYKDRLA